jgi:hypothetical protein
MRLRAKQGIALAAFLMWGGIGAWLILKDDTLRRAEEIEAVNRDLKNPGMVWAREDMHLNSLENWRRPCLTCPQGFLLGEETGLPEWSNPERIRILTVGDSYSVGAGLIDANARWGTRLEQALSRRHGQGTVEVVSIGASAVSAFSYTEWLEAIAREDYTWFKNDETGVLRGTFDAIVIGHIDNDVLYSPGDTYLGVTDLKAIPWGEQGAILEGNKPNPSWEAYTKLPARMAAAGGGAAMLVVPMLNLDARGKFNEAHLQSLYEEADFTVVGTRLGADWLNKTGLERARVSPADLHPGHGYYVAISEDIAAAIETAIGPERIARAKARGGEVRRPLIASHLSLGLKITTNPNGVEASWNGNVWRPTPDTCFGAAGQSEGTYLKCDTYHYQGSRIPAQYLPCAVLGRPHMVLAFASDRRGTSTLKHRDGNDTVLEVYGYRYGEVEIEIEPVARLAAGETGTIDVRGTAGFEGIFVAEAGKTTCEYRDDAAGMVGPFQLHISEPGK